MKKAILDFIILAVLSALLYFLFAMGFRLAGFDGKPFVFAFFFTLFICGFTYKRLWTKDSFSSTSKKVYTVLLFSILFIFSGYLFRTAKNSFRLIEYLTEKNVRGWKGQVHQADNRYGFRPIKNAHGFHTFPVGEDVAMAFNNEGFRVPITESTSLNDSTGLGILFLGCSFTYGDATLAEKTFAHLTAKETNLNYINAGVCSYGLAQMVLLTEDLLPRYKPEFLIVQHSPWLIQRATSIYAPVYFGSLTTPYFRIESDSLIIEKPVFITQIFDQNLEDIKEGIYDGNTFLAAAFFLIKEDFLATRTKVSLLLGAIPPPTNETNRAEMLAYKKMINLAAKQNTKVIILDLYHGDDSLDLSYLVDGKNVFLADADVALRAYLEQNKHSAFDRAFAHYRFDGNDTINVDGHPNPLAHKIISKSLIELINEIN